MAVNNFLLPLVKFDLFLPVPLLRSVSSVTVSTLFVHFTESSLTISTLLIQLTVSSITISTLLVQFIQQCVTSIHVSWPHTVPWGWIIPWQAILMSRIKSRSSLTLEKPLSRFPANPQTYSHWFILGWSNLTNFKENDERDEENRSEAHNRHVTRWQKNEHVSDVWTLRGSKWRNRLSKEEPPGWDWNYVAKVWKQWCH